MKALKSVPVGAARHGVLPARYPKSRNIVQERLGVLGDLEKEFACRQGWNVIVRIWLKITLSGDEVVEILEGIEIPADQQPRRIEGAAPAGKEVRYVAKPPLKLYRLKQLIEAGLRFAENMIVEKAEDLQQKTLKNLYPTLERLRTYYRQLAADAAADDREKTGAIEAEYRRRVREEIQYTRVKATMDLIAVETISTPVLKLTWPLQPNGNSKEVAAVLNLYDGSLISPLLRCVSDDIVLGGSDSQSGVTQELLILPDGSVEIPWISPAASKLIMAVWEEINHEPFPVKVISGQLYCG